MKNSQPETPENLAAELRRLRLEDPAADLRRRTLNAAGEALDARESSRLAGWWRELALAATALLLFAVTPPASLPSIPDLPALSAWHPPTAAELQASAAELSRQLGVERELADYLEKKSLTRALAESSASPAASRYSNLHDPS